MNNTKFVSGKDQKKQINACVNSFVCYGYSKPVMLMLSEYTSWNLKNNSYFAMITTGLKKLTKFLWDGVEVEIEVNIPFSWHKFRWQTKKQNKKKKRIAREYLYL